MLKPQSGLRDSPLALAAAVLGLVSIVLGLGLLTLRIGVSWAQIYARHQSQRFVP